MQSINAGYRCFPVFLFKCCCLHVGGSEGKAHAATEQSESSHPVSEMPDVAESSTRGQEDDPQSESDAGEENPPLPLELTNDVVDGDHLSDAESEEEAAAMDPAEQEEEWEEEDGEENEGQCLSLSLWQHSKLIYGSVVKVGARLMWS